VPDERVFLVGNVMIDTLLANRDRAAGTTILSDLKLSPKSYAVLTLHRPSNVDDPAVLGGLLEALEVIQRDVPIIFPIHPRTRRNLDGTPLGRRLAGMGNIRLIDPAGYLEFLHLTGSALCVLTDSGGIQEETTILKVPCLTLRENTERPITAEIGSNRICGTAPAGILSAWSDLRAGRWRAPQTPPLWDGQAAGRIERILAEKLGAKG
jgi:UDP-N-acetylglucosamine 2-epimerase (non-hydrolysing)